VDHVITSLTHKIRSELVHGLYDREFAIHMQCVSRTHVDIHNIAEKQLAIAVFAELDHTVEQMKEVKRKFRHLMRLAKSSFTDCVAKDSFW
jgi:hypothetical protein